MTQPEDLGIGKEQGSAPRRWGWRAQLEDGLVLDELHEGRPVARFEDIPFERLGRFSLVDAERGWEAIGLDCRTGMFHVRGHAVHFTYGPIALTRRRGVSYQDVLQCKVAHVEVRGDGRSSGVVVDAHEIGYRAEVANIRFRVVLRLDARSGRVSIRVSATRPGDRDGPFALYVCVDNVRLEHPGHLWAALEAPPEVR